MKKIVSLIAGIIIALAAILPYYLLRDRFEHVVELGYSWLFLSCAISNGTVLLPASSILYVVIASRIFNPWICACVGGIGAALGEQVGYICGYMGKRVIVENKLYSCMERWTERYGVKIVLLFAILPLPLFDIVGLLAGSTQMHWRTFMVVCIIGKVIKMVFAMLIVMYVLPIIIEKSWFLPESIKEFYYSFVF